MGISTRYLNWVELFHKSSLLSSIFHHNSTDIDRNTALKIQCSISGKPTEPISTAATARFSSTSNSLDLMKKCKDTRQAKEEKQKIVNKERVQETKSWRETYREQRIKEQQDRNNGIMPKIEKKHRRMH
ncbi:hypothetical protein CAEBREN_09128 [Caenorhabditis brenneri]|uniref:Uncharacterized protein n=1 Tax=Caenorhabditis brenneri TaxID=135651 RepID=G0PAV9_CAEBE|nr:hypothetical protein CAEBREN_09128 [Caenorhabditis brenneri]